MQSNLLNSQAWLSKSCGMDADFSDEDLRFRNEVRAFVAAEFPVAVREKLDRGLDLTKDEILAWPRILGEKGWAAVNWPADHGSAGWSLARKYLFDQVLSEAAVPRPTTVGLSIVGPLLIKAGTKLQKTAFLPDILASTVWWCQGYSEPDAGSDLSKMQTAAVRESEQFVVNGVKTWIADAHFADWMLCLLKVDTGASFLAIDMKSPGISVEPVPMMDGRASVYSVAFEDVAVPAENLIGKAGAAWDYISELMDRSTEALDSVANGKRDLQRLKEVSADQEIDGVPLIEEQSFRMKLSALEIDLIALEYTELRVLDTRERGQELGPEAMILKIKGAEIQQAMTELLVEAVGYYANPFISERFQFGHNEPPIGPDVAAEIGPQYLNARKLSMDGTPVEVQRNNIATDVLGLPAD